MAQSLLKLKLLANFVISNSTTHAITNATTYKISSTPRQKDRIGALDRAAVNSKSDAQSAEVAQSLFALLARNNLQVEPPLRSLWHNAHTGIKTVRIAIHALSKASDGGPVTLAAATIYSKSMLAIAQSQAHVDHLSCYEWSQMVQFTTGLLKEHYLLGTLESTKVSADLFRVLAALLEAREAVNPQYFEPILSQITLSLKTYTEMSMHKPMLSCLRQLLSMTVLDEPTLARKVARLGLCFLDLGYVRSDDLRQEIFTFCASLSSNFGDLLDLSHLKALSLNCKDMHIKPADVEFHSCQEITWFERPCFRLRSFAPLVSAVGSAAIANVLQLLSQVSTSAPGSPRSSKRLKTTSTLFGAAAELELPTIYQILCFTDGLSSNDIEVLLSNPPKDNCFWYLTLLGVNTEKIKPSHMTRTWRLCLDQLSGASSSAACFCLARMIHTGDRPLHSRTMADSLKTLVWQFDVHPTFSPGSISLYHTLRKLRVMSPDFYTTSIPRLKAWFSKQCRLMLAGKRPREVLDILQCLIDRHLPALYTGPLAFIYQNEMMPVVQSQKVLDSLGIGELNDKVTGKACHDLTQRQDLRELFEMLQDTESHPLAQELLRLVYSAEKGAVSFTLPGTFKEDLESVALFSQLVTVMEMQKHISEGLKLSLQDIKRTWPRNDDFDYLLHEQIYSMVCSSINTADDFLDCSTMKLQKGTVDVPNMQKIMITVSKTVFRSYYHQRSRIILQKLLAMLANINISLKEPSELRLFLLSAVTRQSRYSRLRLFITPLLQTFDEWACFWAQSCASAVLQGLCNLQIRGSIEKPQEIGTLTLAIESQRQEVQEVILVECGRKGADLGVIICRLAELGPSAFLSGINRLANVYETGAQDLIVSCLRAIVTEWRTTRGEQPFPFSLLGINESNQFAVYPLRFLGTGYIDDIRWFPDYYVAALSSDVISGELRARYGKNFGALKKKFEPMIIYLMFRELQSLPQDKIWDNFPRPRDHYCFLGDLYMETVDEATGEWIIESLLKEATQQKTDSEIYSLIRKAWQCYVMTPEALSVTRTLVRGLLVLVETLGTCLVLGPIFNVFGAIADHLDNETVAELACVLLPKEMMVEDLLLSLERRHSSSLCHVILSFRQQKFLVKDIEAALPMIDRMEMPHPFGSYIFNGLFQYVESASEAEKHLKDLKSPLFCEQAIKWTRILGLKGKNWSRFVGMRVPRIEEPVSSVTQGKSSDPLKQLVLELKAIKTSQGYRKFRFCLPFLNRLPDDVRELVGLGSSTRECLPEELWSMKRQDLDLHVHSVEKVAASFCELCAGVDGLPSLSLVELFNHIPGLAPKMAPHMIQILASQSAKHRKLLALIHDATTYHLVHGDMEMKRFTLTIAAKANLEGVVLSSCESIIYASKELGLDVFALMFSEQQWCTTGNTNLDELRSICQNISDPDIFHDAKFWRGSPLSTQNISGWPKLDLEIAAQEVYNNGNEKLGKSLRQVGIYKLADKLNGGLLSGYEDAWKLEQWDIPDPQNPKTEPELLFTLFRDPLKVCFNETYSEGFDIAVKTGNIKILNDLYEIERAPLPPLQLPLVEDVRLARERILNRRGMLEGLAMELARNCNTFLEIDDKHAALNTALKLQKLASSSDDSLPQISMISEIESAKVAWSLGNKSIALDTLEQVTRRPQFAEKYSYFDRSEIYCLMARWSHESKQTTDQLIVEKYLEPAELHAKDATKHVQENTFHVFASFCDESHDQPRLLQEIDDAKKMKDGKRKDVMELQSSLETAPAKSEERQRISQRLAKEQKLYQIEKDEHARLLQKQKSFLERAVELYLKSLSVGESNSVHDSSRFVALWMKHWRSDDINAIVAQAVTGVGSFQFIPWVNQLSSRLSTTKDAFQKTLWSLVAKMAKDHPLHVLWHIFALRMVVCDAQDDSMQERAEAGNRMWRLLKKHLLHSQIVNGVSQFGRTIVELAHLEPPTSTHEISFDRFVPRSKTWWMKTLPELKVTPPTANIPVSLSCDYEDAATITSVSKQITIASGLSAPKILRFVLSDGTETRMLIKGGNDDLRQDAIMEQVFTQANDFFFKDRRSLERHLKVRTYKVIPLGPTAGAIEFVKNTKSFMDIIGPLHRERDGRTWTLRRAREVMHNAQSQGREARLAEFKEIEEHIKPVFRYFFFDNFRDSATWFKVRCAYSRSSAVISLVGYVLGLGDRHCNNILIDVQTGEVVHIDLGIAFDQGRLLRIPETVPFRLTRDVVDGMGSCGTAGIFSRCAEITLELLRAKMESMLTILDVLRYDPLYSWTLTPLKGEKAQKTETFTVEGAKHGNTNAPSQSVEASRAILGVRRKLSDQLSAEATVRELVQEASAPSNLAVLFEGWCPFY